MTLAPNAHLAGACFLLITYVSAARVTDQLISHRTPTTSLLAKPPQNPQGAPTCGETVRGLDAPPRPQNHDPWPPVGPAQGPSACGSRSGPPRSVRPTQSSPSARAASTRDRGRSQPRGRPRSIRLASSAQRTPAPRRPDPRAPARCPSWRRGADAQAPLGLSPRPPARAAGDTCGPDPTHPGLPSRGGRASEETDEPPRPSSRAAPLGSPG